MADNNSTGIAEVGRPTAIVPEVIAKLENIFKVGGNIEEACSYAGINKATYYRHLKSDEDFATKMSQAQHYATIVAKNVVVDAIVKNRDLNTAKWWLEKRHPDEFGGTPQIMQQFNVEGGDDGTIEFVLDGGFNETKTTQEPV